MKLLSKQDVVQLDLVSLDLPHALIIYSDDGLDKAGAINSLLSPSDEVTRIEPLDDKNTISIEQIRNLINYLSTTADKRRIVVIENSDLMTEQAQNSFLKSLEEPRQNTHFILATDNRSGLLETIVSRCQTIQLHSSNVAEDNNQLSKYQLTDVEKRQITFIAKGKPLFIHQLAISPQTLSEHSSYVKNARIILSRSDFYESIRCVQAYFKDRQRAKILLDTLANLIDFHIKSNDFSSADIKDLLNNLEVARKSIQSNGNIKLALLLVVV